MEIEGLRVSQPESTYLNFLPLEQRIALLFRNGQPIATDEIDFGNKST